jgi:CPA2 family monovalent cation:H+ antiporter-2
VILCGYGRSGQSLARLLEAEHIPFIALDHDPLRVRAAAQAGDNVVFGDSTRDRSADGGRRATRPGGGGELRHTAARR